MPADHVILHIGAHKTASSLIQSALRTHTQPLLKDGLRVMHRNEIHNTPFFESLWSIKSESDARQALPQGVTEWLHDKAGTDRPNLLMSSEDFFKNFSAPEFFSHIGQRLHFVQRCFPASRLSVILYVRSQPDYLESLYLQHIHLGRTLSFADFLQKYQGTDLSWLRVAGEIASVIGPERTVIRPYESIRRMGHLAFYQDFLRCCGIADVSGYVFDSSLTQSRGANRSYSALALKIANRVNPLLKPDEKKLLRRFLQENFSNVTHARAELFPSTERTAFLEPLHADNMTLFDQYMPLAVEERSFY